MAALPLRLLQGVAALLAALVIGLALFWDPARAPAPAGPVGGDFTLRSADGPVSLSAFRGKVVLIYFGYTYCPDICPTSLAAVAAGLKALSADESARVAALFVSVDPERDTPERLKEYAAFFHPALVGITGSAEAVADVARRYGAYFARHAVAGSSGYVVDHSTDAYLVAPDGRLAGHIPHGAAPDQVAAEIRKFLNPRRPS